MPANRRTPPRPFRRLPGADRAPAAPAGWTYTCCEAADIVKAYRPGETLLLHWIVGGTPADSAVAGIELDAELTGSFAAVDVLKASGGTGAGVSTLKADPVRPTGAPDEQPVSVIPIPVTAVPGYYNLTISILEPGATTRLESIIQVVPAAQPDALR